MAFIGTVIGTLIKMVIVGAFAFCGIRLGKYLRKRHDRKQAEE